MTTFPYQATRTPGLADCSWSWIVLAFGIVFSGAMILFAGDDIGPKIIALIMLWLFASISCKFELSHPYVWYGAFYILYGISAPVLVYYDIHPFGSFGGYDPKYLNFSYVLDLEFLGLVTAFVLIGPRSANLTFGIQDVSRDAIFAGVSPVLILSSAILSALLLEIFLKGFSDKGDIFLHGSFLTRLGFAYNLVEFSFVILAFKFISEDKIPKAYLLIALFCAVALMSVFISGQRNFFFRFAVSIIFILHLTHRRISWVSGSVMLISGLILIYWLGEQKLAWTSGAAEILMANDTDPGLLFGLEEKYLEIINDQPFLGYFQILLITTLGTELLTASNNLALLIERVPYDLPYLNGTTIFISDIARGVLPGFLLGDSLTSSSNVYHEAFFSDMLAKGAGPGFSLLGSGYMNFGAPGVVLIMAIFGLALRYSYRWAEKSALGFLFFIGFLPIAVYTTRGDLSAPLSQGLKHVFLPLVVMAFIGSLRLRSSYVADRRLSVDRRAKGSLVSRHGNRERRQDTGDRRSVRDRRNVLRKSPTDGADGKTR